MEKGKGGVLGSTSTNLYMNEGKKVLVALVSRVRVHLQLLSGLDVKYVENAPQLKEKIDFILFND